VAEGGITTEGVAELIRAADAASKETKTAVRNALRAAAEPVQRQWADTMADYSQVTASGLKTVVRRTGTISVEQSKNKVTGQHPEYGVMQLQKGERILEDASETIERAFEEAVGQVVHIFERTS
jgi:hypothetical protein